MNTFPIANTDDLIRALEQNVEIRNSVRHHLLTEELLNLPNRFARFQAHQDTFNERQEVFNSQQKAMNLRIESTLEKLTEQTRRNSEDIKALTEQTRRNGEDIKALTEQTRRNSEDIKALTEQTRRNGEDIKALTEQTRRNGEDIKTLTQGIKDLARETRRNSEDIKTLTQDIKDLARETRRNGEDIKALTEQTRRNGEDIKTLTQDIKDLTRETRRNGDSIGELKGNLARYALNWHFDEIAEHMGFSYRDTVTRSDLRLLVHRDSANMPLGVRQSFYRADLIMEVADSKGEIHYIAVEASYTADQRDTDRALRNAELLARFTGQPAHAAIASLHNDYAIQRLIDDKAVFWYQLHANDFDPE